MDNIEDFDLHAVVCAKNKFVEQYMTSDNVHGVGVSKASIVTEDLDDDSYVILVHVIKNDGELPTVFEGYRVVVEESPMAKAL